MFFSPNTPQTPESVDDVPPRRRSTTISMMEEEFGMREPPQVAKRFGLPSKLKILPPKRKKTITQIPEPPRDLPSLKGPWEPVWVCDEDDVDFVEPPLEGDLDLPSDSVSNDHDDSFNHAAFTSTRVAPWSMDGEVTPRFSSNFPITPESDATGGKVAPT